MNYLIVMLELWCLLLICLVLGRRLTSCLPQVMIRTIGLYVAPILGVACLVLLSTLYGWITAFKPIYSIAVLSLLIGGSIGCDSRKKELLRHGLYLCIFSTICALPILAPIIRYSGYNPFTDIFTYLAQSQWLQGHSFAEKVITSGHYPIFTQVSLYQESGSRMGGTFLLGFVQSLFALRWSYDAYIPTVALGLVTGCWAIGGIIRQVIPVKKSVIFALALLPSLLMNGFIYGAEWGFFPQTIGLALAIGVSALFPSLTRFIVRTDISSSRLSVYTLPLAVCAAALLFAYNEPFPIFVASIGLFLLFVMSSYTKKIPCLLLFVVVFTGELFFLINYEAIRIIKNVYQTLSISNGGADIGWPVLWSPIQFLAFAFGMKSPFNHRLLSLDTPLSLVIAPVIVVCVIIILMRFIQSKPKRQLAIQFLGCFELVLLFFFIQFRYLSANKSLAEVGNTFLQFKIAKYAAPFSLSLLAIAGAILWYYLKKQRTLMQWIYGIIIIMSVYFHGVVVSKNFTAHFLKSLNTSRDPFNVLLQLRDRVKDIPADQVIYLALGSEQSKLRQMVAYILYDRRIASDYSDDGYILGRLPLQDRVMPLDKADWLITMKQPQVIPDQTHRISGPFMIQQKPFRFIRLEKQEGGYATEQNNDDVFNWVNQSIDCLYAITGDYQAIQLKLQLKTQGTTSRSYHITVKTKSGQILANYTLSSLLGNKYFLSPWIPIHSNNELIVHVDADGQPIRLSLLDSRTVRFMISNMAMTAK